jgi:GT2 family glycosyltransferase
MDISIVVVNYHTYPMIDRFLSSYDQYRPKVYTSEVIVVDNESTPQADGLSLPHGVRVERFEENLGYAKACNYGASLSDSKYIGIFNSDTYFVNDLCIDRLITFMEQNPDVGVVGPLQYSQLKQPRKFTAAGVEGTRSQPKHRGWKKVDRGEYRDVLDMVMIAGSAMVVRREAWNEIMCDPTYRSHWPNALGAMPEHFLYYEDTALCYAMHKFGYRVVFVGDQGAEMVHEWHKTIGNSGQTHFKNSRTAFRALMDDWGIERD